MADRANIVILDPFSSPEKGGEPVPLFLYTHWGGISVPQILAAALDSPEGRARRNHPAYLARIIFDILVTTASDDETGVGISAGRAPDQDLVYPYLVVEWREFGVLSGSHSKYPRVRAVLAPMARDDLGWLDRDQGVWWPADEFVALVDDGIGAWDRIRTALREASVPRLSKVPDRVIWARLYAHDSGCSDDKAAAFGTWIASRPESPGETMASLFDQWQDWIADGDYS